MAIQNKKAQPKNTTRCVLLDEAGVIAGDMYKGKEICLNCPYPECIVKIEDDLKIKK